MNTEEQAPVLILAHKRVAEFQAVFDQVLEAPLRRIYVFCDGPRDVKEAAAQKSIFEHSKSAGPQSQVFWNFQKVNLGLRQGVITGIDWFLDKEEAGIILEDDTLPSPDFFDFCDRGLDLYRHSSTVQQISGYNALGPGPWLPRPRKVHFFSPRMNCWGWATWRDRWQNFRAAAHIGDADPKRSHAPVGLYRELEGGHRRAAAGEVDSWAYSWAYYSLTQQRLSVVPASNTVENIGFGPEATHTHFGGSARVHPVAKNAVFPASVRVSLGFAYAEHFDARLKLRVRRLRKRIKGTLAWGSRVVLRRLCSYSSAATSRWSFRADRNS
jgi:glycosyltransferase involved in cell wall biosynthesis